MTNIHLLTITPMGTLIVYCDRGWQFRVLSDGSIYRLSKHYYTAETAENAGRQWKECMIKVENSKQKEKSRHRKSI